MRTFTPTSGIGSRYFLGSTNLLNDPINNSTITSTIRLTSDEILIDSQWRYNYEDFDSTIFSSPTYNLMKELIDREIIKEIDLSSMPNSNNYKDELSNLIYNFLIVS